MKAARVWAEQKDGVGVEVGEGKLTQRQSIKVQRGDSSAIGARVAVAPVVGEDHKAMLGGVSIAAGISPCEGIGAGQSDVGEHGDHNCCQDRMNAKGARRVMIGIRFLGAPACA